jgi:hypothetical protein
MTTADTLIVPHHGLIVDFARERRATSRLKIS